MTLKAYLPIAFAALLASPAAFAAVTPVLSEAALNANDTVLWSQFGPDSTFVDTPSTWVSVGGVTGGIASSAPSLETRVQNIGWFGDFPAGETVIFQPNSESAQDTSENVFIRFDAPVFAVGAYFESNQIEDFTISIEAFDSADNSLGSFSQLSLDNALLFFGVESDTAEISFIRIRNNTVDTFDDSYAFGTLFLRVPADVPAPAAAVLFGFGLLGVGLRRR